MSDSQLKNGFLPKMGVGPFALTVPITEIFQIF